MVGRRGGRPDRLDAYVNGLSQAERDRIALYLNFDMVGSPNYIFMVYDGDESGFAAPVAVPPGSVAIEDLFESYYTRSGEPYDDAAVQRAQRLPGVHPERHPGRGPVHRRRGRQDRRAGGIWGGTVGAQFDPCYHLACDTFANNNNHALERQRDPIAFAVLTYAYSTESVNGVPGKRCRATSRFRRQPARRGHVP